MNNAHGVDRCPEDIETQEDVNYAYEFGTWARMNFWLQSNALPGMLVDYLLEPPTHGHNSHYYLIDLSTVHEVFLNQINLHLHASLYIHKKKTEKTPETIHVTDIILGNKCDHYIRNLG